MDVKKNIDSKVTEWKTQHCPWNQRIIDDLNTKKEKDFEKCWAKVNGGSSIDQALNPQKKLVKYHSEVIYREAVKMKMLDHVKTILGVTILSLLIRMIVIPFFFPDFSGLIQ